MNYDRTKLKPGTLLRCKSIFFHAKPGEIVMLIKLFPTFDEAHWRFRGLTPKGMPQNFAGHAATFFDDWEILPCKSI